MAKIYCKSSYLLRRDTAENWQNKNPILRKGEQGLETDTGIIKIGDGATEYNSLSDDNIYLPKSRINKSVDDVKSYVNNNFSNALKGSKSGSAILIDDISPVTHEMGVKVRGKNLFDINGFINLTGNSTYYGINDNGELYVKQSDYRDDTVIPAFVTLEAGTYTLSNTTPITSNFKLINLTDNTVISYNNNITFSIEKATSLGIKCWQAADTVIGKLQLELGTTPTDYTSYVPDLTAVKVTRCGKNFIDIDSIANDIVAKYPTTCEITEFDGKRCLKIGAISPEITYTIPTSIPLYGLQLKVYDTGYNKSFMSVTKNDTGSSKLYISTSTSNEWATVTRYYTYDTQYFTEMQFYKSDVTKPIYIDLDSVMLEASHTTTEYEPYVGAEYTPNADGTVDGVSSIYPNTNLTTDTEGVLIDCEYNRDINKAFAELQQAIISLGGNI